jgi:HlyD family secretion protein
MKKRKTWLILLAALALIAGGGYVAYDRFLAPSEEIVEEPTIQTATVQRGDISITAAGSGELVPADEVNLAFGAGGTVMEVLVEVGGRVQAGDVLARLDTAPLERAVIQARADLIKAENSLEEARNPYTDLDLAQARLSVTQAQVALDEAREGLEEAQNPYTEQDLAQAQLAVAEAEAERADAQEALQSLLSPDLKAARAAVRDAEVSLESAKAQLVVAQNDSDNAAKIRTLEAEMNWYRNNYWEVEQEFQKGKVSQQDLDAAYSNMLAAEERYTSAVAQADSSLVTAQNRVTQAEENLRDAQENLADLMDGPDAIDLSQAENRVAQAEHNLAQAKEDLADIETGADASAVARMQTEVSQAEYNLAKAQETLDEMEAGPDPDDIEVAEANLISAQANLEEAEDALAAAELTAPFTGTLTTVDISVGDTVSSEKVVMALANLAEPQLRFWVEESDLSSVAVGNKVEIVFEALPDYTFPGEILSVDPALVSVGGTPAVQAYASIDLSAHPVSLLSGMNADVEIVAGEALNALLVPVQALRELGTDQYAVFVVGADGELEMRPVEVGLQDFVNAEIVSGLEAGEVVSTGTTSGSSTSDVAVNEMELPTGGMMFPGGR